MGDFLGSYYTGTPRYDRHEYDDDYDDDVDDNKNADDDDEDGDYHAAGHDVNMAPASMARALMAVEEPVSIVDMARIQISNIASSSPASPSFPLPSSALGTDHVVRGEARVPHVTSAASHAARRRLRQIDALYFLSQNTNNAANEHELDAHQRQKAVHDHPLDILHHPGAGAGVARVSGAFAVAVPAHSHVSLHERSTTPPPSQSSEDDDSRFAHVNKQMRFNDDENDGSNNDNNSRLDKAPDGDGDDEDDLIPVASMSYLETGGPKSLATVPLSTVLAPNNWDPPPALQAHMKRQASRPVPSQTRRIVAEINDTAADNQRVPTCHASAMPLAHPESSAALHPAEPGPITEDNGDDRQRASESIGGGRAVTIFRRSVLKVFSRKQR